MMIRALRRVRAALLRRRHEREMQEEMTEHLERASARFAARGMSQAEARRAAEREFGNVAWLQEQARDARGTAWLDALLGDLRYALRQYARRPATTLVMFIVLAFGMGITTLLFSFVHSYATQPPPGVVLTEDLVRIRGSRSAGPDGRGSRPFSEDEFRAYRDLTGHFSAVAGWTAATVVIDLGPEAAHRGVEARVTFVTDNYFSVLDVRPQFGFVPIGSAENPSLIATAVVSHGTWDALFGRDPDIVGKVISVNGVSVAIAGVAPERFRGVAGWGRLLMWMPLEARDLLVQPAPDDFRAAGRLLPGVTPQQASAAAASIARTHAAEAVIAGQSLHRDPSTEVVPLRSASGDPMFERDVKWMSAAIGLLALLVLLVTCTNVSALLTGFATARRHEIAIRLSLGAARSRLIRQLLTESTLLALGSAAAALAIVAGTMHAVRVLIVELPLTPQITWSATSFTIALGITVGMLFGLSPALHATRLAVASVLRDASANLVATRARLQRGLVVAQIAFTQPLTVLVAALLVLVVTQLKTSPRSPMEDRIVIMTAQAPEAASMTNEEQASSESSRLEPARLLEERLAMMPGVVRVARTAPRWPAGVRIGGYTTEAGAVLAGGAQKVAALSAQPVHPEYFAAFDVPVLRGRTFSSEDEALFSGSRTAPAVIDQALAQHLWPDADPLGAVLRPATDTASNAPSLIIIGVVDDPAARRGVDKVDHFVYLPAGAADYGGFVLRTAAPAAPLLPGIRAVIQEIAPATVMGVTTLEAIADGHERNFRMAAGGVSAAGLVALLLAALGLYAVVAFSVGQRTREIAVRVALGGHRRQIVAHFVADGLRLTAIGLLIGLPISLVGLRALISAMGDAPELSLSAVTAIAALGVLTIAAAAAWLPARHAANVDPAVTLRSD